MNAVELTCVIVAVTVAIILAALVNVRKCLRKDERACPTICNDREYELIGEWQILDYTVHESDRVLLAPAVNRANELRLHGIKVHLKLSTCPRFCGQPRQRLTALDPPLPTQEGEQGQV
jgi:hypothetical protein